MTLECTDRDTLVAHEMVVFGGYVDVWVNVVTVVVVEPFSGFPKMGMTGCLKDQGSETMV